MTIREQLLNAVGGERRLKAADRLCRACLTLLEVDAAAISLIFDGTNEATMGSSGPPAWTYDELLVRGAPKQLDGAITAAELAAIPVLDFMDADLQAAVSDPTTNAWAEWLSSASTPQRPCWMSPRRDSCSLTPWRNRVGAGRV